MLGWNVVIGKLKATYLKQKLPILFYRLVCIICLDLLLRFDLNVEVDLDLLVFEVVVQSEGGGRLGFGALGVGNENLRLEQDAKVGVKNFISQSGGLLNLRVSESVGFIEKQENSHLVCRYLESVRHLGVLDVVRLDFSLAELP